KEEIILPKVIDVWEAIKKLKVRGAPAIGIAAGYGVLISALTNKGFAAKEFREKVLKDIEYLKTSRPTAVNLFLVLEQFERLLSESFKDSGEYLQKIEKLAVAVHKDDEERCRRIGEYGQQVIPKDAVLLTHCNTGTLATGGIGTALGIVYTAVEKGKNIKVYVDETRPLLQGSRLTAYELQYAGINATLISDNMAAAVMANTKIDAILVGADRIAANGDTANKIGTYGLAVLAKHHKIPFYTVAPLTTFDMKIKSGKEIPIEERDPLEVKKIKDNIIAPEEINVYNPAFDVTPHELISGIITDHGIIECPDLKKVNDFYFKFYTEPK
ncbi:MAG: S-methyl-5-thioribose-1-phosphate isomerase, partial [Calditrichia bacterium]|nr:S-methyl-5-thioribose-1-phosphate isomerase [Calditrichia bacterium]